MSLNLNRLRKDLAELGKDNEDGVIVVDVQDMGNIKIILTAPMDSPYATGFFDIDITVDIQQFPLVPPLFTFKTKVFHPNISCYDGEVCVNRLKEDWSPSITLRGACEIVQGLLRESNPGSPLNLQAGRMMRRNAEMFFKTAQMWTKVYARGIQTNDYEEALNVVTAVAGTEARALRTLTETNWDIQKACDEWNI